jgi:hypothetical protein
MTFEELDRTYPNAFDDADLTSFTLNYEHRTAKIELNLRGNPPESPNSHEYKRAVLLLDGFYYFVIEPPDAEHLWYPQRSIQIDGHTEDASQFPLFNVLQCFTVEACRKRILLPILRS